MKNLLVHRWQSQRLLLVAWEKLCEWLNVDSARSERWIP
jgi:hypothetical protein